MKSHGKTYGAFDFCMLQTKSERALRQYIGDRLEKFNLSVNEWLVLNVVALGPRQGVGVSSIAQSMDITMPQATPLVKGLIEQELAKEKTLPSDKRRRFVTTTLKGRRVLQRVDAKLVDLEKAGRSVDDNDLEGYMTTINKLFSAS